MFHAKLCAVCGSKFIPSSNNSKYCSDPCKKEGSRLIPRKPRSKKIVSKVCIFCNKPYETSNSRQRYCNDECAHAGALLIRRINARTKKESGLCPHCGFRPLMKGLLTCEICRDSNSEANALRRLNAKEAGLCRECGTPSNGKTYCPVCASNYNAKHKTLVSSRKESHLCTRCGDPLPTDYQYLMCVECLDIFNTHNSEVRLTVFTHYGMSCSCCGESFYDFLSLDHINNDGAAHRKKVGGGGILMYKWVIKNNFPSEFQTLCFNCNMGKHGNKGECPHKGKLNIDMNSDYNKIKKQVFDHYGMKCACCPEANYLFLSIDHIKGDGAAHRRIIGGGGNKLYYWLKSNNYPADFQLLCHNCNSSKGIGLVCAHKLI